MADETSRLGAFMTGACTGAGAVGAPAHNLAEVLFREELRRGPDPAGLTSVEEAIAGGQPAAEIRRRIRSSVERMTISDDLVGAASASYRDLAAIGDIELGGVAPVLIAECIGAYRLLLFREPDASGFRTYVEERARRPLVSLLAGMIGSAEAQKAWGQTAMTAAELAPLVVIEGSQVLHAVIADAAHAKAHRMLDRLDTILRRIEALEGRLDRMNASVEMRLDAEAAR